MSVENNDEIMVSVLIITYNQKEYIRQAVESVLSQETDFKYEILIHDDASTDGTTEIVREYELKYPELVTAVLEENNLFQKNPHLRFHLMLRDQMKGKYFALLEGDDYWTDNNKLQFQVSFLESHPNYIGCAHNTSKLDMFTGKKEKMYRNKDHEVTVFDILDWKDRAFHANSLMFRKKYLYDQPEFVKEIDEVGDLPLDLYLAISGKLMYFGKTMSVYRYGVKGSFTERSLSGFYGDKEKEKQHEENYRNFLKMAMDYAGDEYKEFFKYKFGTGIFNRLNSEDDYPAIKRNAVCNEILMHWTFAERMRLFIRYVLKAVHIPWREMLHEIYFWRTPSTDRIYRCAVCDHLVDYKPLSPYFSDNILKYGGIKHVPETLNERKYVCEYCGAPDRSRLMVSFLKRWFENRKNLSILQIAPDEAISNWIIRKYPRYEYKTLDLFMDGVDYHDDIMNMVSIEDNRFDVIICSHVLEHVRDDLKALSEISRVLKDDGVLVLLVPVDLDVDDIDEEWGLSAEENWRRFGQDDHCRRYGRKGLIERLKSCGMFLHVLGLNYFGEKCFEDNALIPTSKLYVLTNNSDTIFRNEDIV